eukprot:365408-Chlamydomonas_euryale.AAC.30
MRARLPLAKLHDTSASTWRPGSNDSCAAFRTALASCAERALVLLGAPPPNALSALVATCGRGADRQAANGRVADVPWSCRQHRP